MQNVENFKSPWLVEYKGQWPEKICTYVLSIRDSSREKSLLNTGGEATITSMICVTKSHLLQQSYPDNNNLCLLMISFPRVQPYNQILQIMLRYLISIGFCSIFEILGTNLAESLWKHRTIQPTTATIALNNRFVFTIRYVLEYFELLSRD